MNSNPAIAKKFINLFNYLFDLFVSFSHLLVTRTSPLRVKRQEKTPSHRFFDSFFLTGTFERIGSKCVESENIMNSTQKKFIEV